MVYLLGLEMMHVCTCGGKLFPKLDQSEWPCSPFGKEIRDILVRVDDLVLEVLLYSYVGMDWRGCVNIHFTVEEPTDDRGNIIFIFSLN